MTSFSSSLRFCAPILFTGVLGAASVVQAQTRFQFPDTIPDVTRYRHVEECLAATRRVVQSEHAKRQVWRDTAIVSTRDSVLDTLPSHAVATARLCSARFNPDSAPAQRFSEWMQLFLMANRQDAAEAVVRSQIEAIQPGPQMTEQLYQVLNTAFIAYNTAQPMRWDKMLATVDSMRQRNVLSLTPSLEMYLRMVLAVQAEAIGDTVVFSRAANEFLVLPKSLSAEEKATPEYQRSQLPMMAMWISDRLYREALLDSLRHSTASYLALKRANWYEVSGQRDTPLPLFIGQRAPKIIADFWFRSSDSVMTSHGAGLSTLPGMTATSSSDASSSTPSSTPVRPAPGRVSLIVFLQGGCRSETPANHRRTRTLARAKNCWETYAVMHRLAKQFPALDMTIVSQTAGFLGDAPPTTPQDEAEAMRAWWLGYHRLPATLAVSNTKFFRLPAPDLRRIDYPVPVSTEYMFGTGPAPAIKTAYLVDRDGIIVHSGPLTRAEEIFWRQIVDALVQQPR